MSWEAKGVTVLFYVLECCDFHSEGGGVLASLKDDVANLYNLSLNLGKILLNFLQFITLFWHTLKHTLYAQRAVSTNQVAI